MTAIPVQTTYGTTLPVAFAGMRADNADANVDSYLNAEASAEMPFGVFVAVGGSLGDQGAILPAASTAKLLGVLQHAHGFAIGTQQGTTGLKAGVQLPILTRGRIWVVSETAAAPGDPVFVRYAAGAGGTQLGAVRNATVASEMIDHSSKAKYLTTCLAGGLAIISVNELS